MMAMSAARISANSFEAESSALQHALDKPLNLPAALPSGQTDRWLSFIGDRPIQTKLKVSSPTDALELEADRVADQVTRRGEPVKAITMAPLQLNRKCSACEEETQVLQRKQNNNLVAPQSTLQTAEAAISRPGTRLDPKTSNFMASRFGADFSQVRVHTDSEAAQSAAAMGAKAYTVGSDIVFGAGQFNPGNESGRHLLAHELTHVIQQRHSQLSIQREVDDENGAEWGDEDEEIAEIESEEGESVEGLDSDGVLVADAFDMADEGIATEESGVPSNEAFEAKGGQKPGKEKGGKGGGKGGSKGKDKPAPKKPVKKPTKTDACAGNCPQGKQPKTINDDCGESQANDKDNFITKLHVEIGKQIVTATWKSGKVEQWPCSPNPRATPKVTTKVGVKCSINHTNGPGKNGKPRKDGMAWFTGFKSEGKRIGFHDSQRVGAGVFSHGCVRVCCDVAKKINENTSSGVTDIEVVK